MPRCTRKGCGKEFEAEKAEACTFHPGAPVRLSHCFMRDCGGAHDTSMQVFHEGLKSWSCCQEFNKPVLDFDEFMNLPVRSSLQLDDRPQSA
jgi:hypothetical protein